jgi:hypothetical protein
MGKSQRVKGSVYEREVMAEFSTALGKTYKRHIGQARDGGHDGLAGLWLIECKRRKNLKTLEGWLKQAQWARVGMHMPPEVTPVVVMRADAGESMVLIRLADFLPLVTLRDTPEGT